MNGQQYVTWHAGLLNLLAMNASQNRSSRHAADSGPMRIKIEKWSLLALARFVLAFIVAVGHIDHRHLAPLSGLLWAVPRFGPFEAVLGFLLISGYSIGSSYRQEPEGFLLRRAWRIYPVYIGALVLTYFASMQALDAQLAITLLQNVLFLNQITTDTSFVVPGWSLALEAWLYCLTPWLWRLKTEHLRALIYASFAAFCCYELSRTVFHLPYYAGAGYGINLPVLSFAWLAGLLMAREPSKASRTVRDCALLFCGYVLMTVAVQYIHRWKHGELEEFFSKDALEYVARALTLAAIVLLFKLIVEGRTGPARNRTMRLLGDISYPLYMVHYAVFTFVWNFGIRNATLQIGAALVVAFAFHWCIDFYSRTRERRPGPDAVTAAATRETPLVPAPAAQQAE